MSVALPLLAARMPGIVADGPGEWLPVSGNTGPVHFPLRFGRPVAVDPATTPADAQGSGNG